jgi:hypothetical protein
MQPAIIHRRDGRGSLSVPQFQPIRLRTEQRVPVTPRKDRGARQRSSCRFHRER